MKRKDVIRVLFFVVIIVIITVFYMFDPSHNTIFLSCPLKSISGYDCPGCGSQRAFHSFLHFRFLEAFRFNPLFVLAMPFLMLFVMSKIPFIVKKLPSLALVFKNKKLIFFMVIIVFVFFIFRNTDYYRELISVNN